MFPFKPHRQQFPPLQCNRLPTQKHLPTQMKNNSTFSVQSPKIISRINRTIPTVFVQPTRSKCMKPQSTPIRPISSNLQKFCHYSPYPPSNIIRFTSPKNVPNIKFNYINEKQLNMPHPSMQPEEDEPYFSFVREHRNNNLLQMKKQQKQMKGSAKTNTTICQSVNTSEPRLSTLIEQLKRKEIKNLFDAKLRKSEYINVDQEEQDSLLQSFDKEQFLKLSFPDAVTNSQYP